jgi:hypothetical protein
MGGAGKSIIAQAFLRDNTVSDYYRDGIVWIDVGQTPNIQSLQLFVARQFGLDPEILDATDGNRLLEHILRDALSLIVLDNVWDLDVVRAFTVNAPGAHLLVTTRSADAVYSDADVIEVGPMDTRSALDVIAVHSQLDRDSLPARVSAIAEYCGGLPLALAAFGGMIADGYQWHEIEAMVRQHDITDLSIRSRGYSYTSVNAALKVSIDSLTYTEQECLTDLTVLGGRGLIPRPAIYRLWALRNISSAEASRTLIKFARRSLLTRVHGNRIPEVHDILAAYLDSTRPESEHRRLRVKFASTYFMDWGGLNNNLPGLKAISTQNEDHAFGFQAAISILASAHKYALIHRLLQMAWIYEANQQHSSYTINVWFSTHEILGSPADYLSDIDIASKLSQSARHPSAQTRGLEVYYALIRASLSDYRNRPIPRVVQQLVKRGYWSPWTTLAQLDVMEDLDQRISYLRSILSEIPDVIYITIFPYVRGLIADVQTKSVAQSSGRNLQNSLDLLLADLVRAAPDVLLRQVASLVMRARGMNSFAAAVLAPRLNADLLGPLLVHVGDSANGWDIARLTASLAPNLRKQVVSQLIELARTLELGPRCRVIASVARGLPVKAFCAEILHVLNAYNDTGRGVWQFRPVEELLNSSPPDAAGEIIDAIRSANLQAADRACALSIMAKMVESSGTRHRLQEEIIGLAPDDMRSQFGVLLRVAARCSPSLIPRVRNIVIEALHNDIGGDSLFLETNAPITASSRRHMTSRGFGGGWELDYMRRELESLTPPLADLVSFISSIAQRAPAARAGAIGLLAYELAHGIRDPSERLRLLKPVIAHLDERTRHSLLHDLLADRNVLDREHLGWLMTEIVEVGLASDDVVLREVITACRLMPKAWQRARVFGRLAQVGLEAEVHREICEEALRSIRQDFGDIDRAAFDLSEIITALPETLSADVEELFSDILGAGGDVERILYRKAEEASGVERDGYIVAALAAVGNEFYSHVRAFKLADIAALIDREEDRVEIANLAVDAAMRSSETWQLVSGVTAAAKVLPPPKRDHALSLVLNELLDQSDLLLSSDRAEELPRILPALSRDLLRQYEGRIRAVVGDQHHFELDFLLLDEEAPGFTTNIQRLVTHTRADSRGLDRVSRIIRLAWRMAATMRNEVIEAELQYAASVSDARGRLAALRVLADIVDANKHDDLLAYAKIEDVRSWAMKAFRELSSQAEVESSSLAAILPYLPDATLAAVAEVAERESEPQSRFRLLVLIAERCHGVLIDAVHSRLLDTAKLFKDTRASIVALRRVGEKLDTIGRVKLSTECLKLAAAIEPHLIRAEVIADLLTDIPWESISYAMQVARRGDRRYSRSEEGQIGLLGELSLSESVVLSSAGSAIHGKRDTERSGANEEMDERSAANVDGGLARARLILALGESYGWEEDTHEYSSELLAIIGSLATRQPYQCADLVRRAAAVLPEIRMQTLRDQAAQISSPYQCMRALVAIVSRWPDSYTFGVLRAKLTEVESAYLVLRGSFILACASQGAEKRRLADEAVAALHRSNLDPRRKARVLADYCPLLGLDYMETALDAVALVEDWKDQYFILVDLMRKSIGEHRKELLDRCHVFLNDVSRRRRSPGQSQDAELTTVGGGMLRLRLIVDLAYVESGDGSGVDDDDAERMILAVDGSGDDVLKAAAVSALVPILGGDHLDRIAGVALSISDRRRRIESLSKVAAGRVNPSWVRDWRPIFDEAPMLGREALGRVILSATKDAGARGLLNPAEVGESWSFVARCWP